MNTNFIINMGCRFCNMAREALCFFNINMPPEQQISNVDILRGKPENAFMEELFQNPDPGEWFVPVVVMDKPRLRRIHNSYIRDRGQRIFIEGVWDAEHHYIMMSQFAKGRRV